ncbi:MAG: thiolase family protein [Candidatus Lindowbacteria bacterium]|nr:thiolase family protein [Candidatus Lindowbacteria bacterium]
MRKVKIIGGAVTKFGKHMDRNMKSLVAEAVTGALKDAGVTKEQIQGAWVGNAAQGLNEGQECIRGQVVLRAMGIGGIPVVNVENACASSATALNGAWAMVALGEMDVALVVGMEKMYYEDRSKVMKGFMAGMDVEVVSQLMEAFKQQEEEIRKAREARGEKQPEKSGQRSIFMDAYAAGARYHMKTYGTTQRQLAVISSKNHFHSSMNPLAQYQKAMTVEEVLAAPEVAWPLTRPMCAPVGDGAAAAIICSEDFSRRLGSRYSAEIAACMLASGEDREASAESTLMKLARKAYEKAGIGPQDINLAEVHDATAFGELSSVEQLMICPVGEGGSFADAGHTTLGGKVPVNISGGLESQGHPVGATGCRQVVELFWHLTGRAGKRQVEGAKAGLAQNAGGSVGGTEAALSVTILKA